MTLFTDQAFAEALPDAIVVLNGQKEAVWWNAVATKLFNLTDKQAPLPITDVIAASDFDQLVNHPATTALEIPAPYQPEMTWSLSMLPYQKNHAILIAKDVTHINHLEKMRQDFVANVSHELRTPLTVTHGYIETLLEQNHADTAPWRPIFIQMQHQTLRMESVVTDLLLLSRLETDLPEAKKQQRVAVDSLLESICADARALSGERHHRITLETQGVLGVFGCSDELRSAFSNLIFNAVNYTPAGGSIEVRWSVQENEAILAVQDTGIGIAAEHIPRLTQRFYRVDKSRSRAAGGSGLGLAIVKHVLLRHDAHLSITSTLGQGSCFQCVFPKQRVML